MRSSIYDGVLLHRRTSPTRHEFRYPIGFFALDLDELPEVGRSLRLFSRNRPNLVSFYDRDHLDGRDGDTAAKLRVYLRAQGLDFADGRILLVTQCRMFHYVFNPVSFFYCHDADDRLRCIVAEVNNTFGERLLYPLSEPSRGAADGARCYTARKALHVSPFISMDASYEFRFSPVEEEVSVSIVEHECGRHVLDAHLRGVRGELRDRELLRFLVRYPLLTFRITLGIHWQALRLYRKGAPFHRQPPPSAEQRAQSEQLSRFAREVHR